MFKNVNMNFFLCSKKRTNIFVIMLIIIIIIKNNNDNNNHTNIITLKITKKIEREPPQA